MASRWGMGNPERCGRASTPPSLTRLGFLVVQRLDVGDLIQPGFTPVINSVMW